MIEDSTLVALQKIIRQGMNDASDRLSSGNCKDFPEYRYLTGVIYGMALVERELIDLDNRLKED